MARQNERLAHRLGVAFRDRSGDGSIASVGLIGPLKSGAAFALIAAWGLFFLWATPAAAQNNCFGDVTWGGDVDSTIAKPENCTADTRCYPPELAGSGVSFAPGCDPSAGPCDVTVTAQLRFPGNRDNEDFVDASGLAYSFATFAVFDNTGSGVGGCGVAGAVIQWDTGTATIRGQAKKGDIFTIVARACPCSPEGLCPLCEKTESFVIPIGSPPPQDDCDDCKACPLPGASAGGGGPKGTTETNSGPETLVYYTAGGTGAPGTPGADEHAATLGHGFAHNFSERLVAVPDDPYDAERVWMLTRKGTFRQFWNLQGGEYLGTAPSDEYRTLFATAAGYELRGLDGTVQSFDAAGVWTGTADASGNATTPAYDASGLLTAVALPDGRQETFTYHPAGSGQDGKLATITEVGIDGTSTLTWTYTWSGDTLVRIDAPDGTALAYGYDDPRHPGFRTLTERIGTDASRRVERGYAYDDEGNVVQTWRGDTVPAVAGVSASLPGSNAVDHETFAFDDPVNPTVTTRTDALGKIATYAIGRDPSSGKARVTSIAGDCPACGLGPNSQIFYDDPDHPLLPTRSIDGRGTVTAMTYDGNGRMTSRTEALGTPEERTTTWSYDDPAFPAVATTIEEPSTTAGASRTTTLVLGADGHPTTRTVSGVEAASAFSLTTATTYTPEGQVATIDPPGFGSDDVTGLTYDPARGGQIPLSRTDPIVGSLPNGGATTFGYDPFNRRTSVTDPNGLETVTAYDAADRVTSVIQKGATAAEDLVTVHQYTAFGDLERTILPEGNAIEYAYDSAGRLTSIGRGPAPGALLERTLYELDAAGNRTRETLQGFDGSAWTTASETAYLYDSRCQLDKIVRAPGTPQEAITEYRYDCNGNLESLWDANHSSASDPPTQSYTYDRLDRLTAIDQPWATGQPGEMATTTYAYDVQDHLVAVTDAEGNTTAYVYSDRDLLTRQDSPVSGASTFAYNDHGELVSETDGRGVTTTRTIDAARRVTFLDSDENALDTAYTYDDPAVPFSAGRLTAITRDTQSIDYAYDRFGRTIQDGTLAYAYDTNGNRTAVTYPGGVAATTTHDYADREETLAVTDGATSTNLVTAAAYLPSGPLTSLALGNGLAETRSFDARYFPAGIAVPGRLDWTYSTDTIGNILEIADTGGGGDRTYTYQDVHYFLTSGTGPWGSLAFTYDKIGNRLSETRDAGGSPQNRPYAYPASPSGGNLPKLASITDPAGDRLERFFFDDAGNQTYRATQTAKHRLSYDALGRMGQIKTDSDETAGALVTLAYDGRSFLREATRSPFPGQPATVTTNPTYSSDGLLMHKATSEVLGPDDPRGEGSATSDAYVLYFAGRPVGVLDNETVTPLGGTPTSTSTLTYLTTDHLGTPVLATDDSGTTTWAGGFEPFGDDWQAETGTGASDAGVFLRFPGQWDDPAWGGAGTAGTSASDPGFYYNVHRWYEPGTGRYARVDPLGKTSIDGTRHLFAYSESRPLFFVDPNGLKVVIEDGGVQTAYDNLKDCFPFFRNLMDHYETQTGFRGRDITWSIKQPVWNPPSCNAGGLRGEERTAWVPKELDCELMAKCMVHEFYERWLIDVGGHPQSKGGTGSANDMAKAKESTLPAECCCPTSSSKESE